MPVPLRQHSHLHLVSGRSTVKLAEILKQDAEGMYDATQGLFHLVDDLDWKPATGSNWMTTRQLVMHCTNSCGFAIQGFVTGDWGLPPGQSFEELPPEEMLPPAERMPGVDTREEAIELLRKDRELCADVLSGLDDARLLGQRSAAPWGGPELTLFQHCNSMIWHLGQHKGQLFYYLKLQGKEVNTMHLWGA
jgi:hypothetical protein